MVIVREAQAAAGKGRALLSMEQEQHQDEWGGRDAGPGFHQVFLSIFYLHRPEE